MEDQASIGDAGLEEFGWNLLQDLDSHALCWILSDKLYSSVLVYDHGAMAVRSSTAVDLPWPVCFMLGYRHKKHRYVSSGAPGFNRLFSSMAAGLDKLRWRNFFRDNESNLPRKMIYRKTTKAFSAKRNPACEKLLQDLSSCIQDAAQAGYLRSRHSRRLGGNSLAIERAASGWLVGNKLIPIDGQRWRIRHGQA